MTNILIIYATTDGQTAKIGARLRDTIESTGNRATVLPITATAGLDLLAYDKIVIGASIRYGKHSPLVAAFIRNNQQILESKPNAFFSVNVVARKPEKRRPEANPYLQKFLRHINWRPQQLAVFAGKIDYPSYRPIDRLMIRLIMWMTKGPTDPQVVVEFTDWQQVEAFGRSISRM